MPLTDDRERLAFENLAGDESLTDELADEPAAKLLDWALRQVSPMAKLADEELQVGDVLGRVRRVTRAVNRLIGRLGTLDPDAVAFRLERLLGYYAPLMSDDELAVLQARLQDWSASVSTACPDEALDKLLAVLDLADEPGEMNGSENGPEETGRVEQTGND